MLPFFLNIASIPFCRPWVLPFLPLHSTHTRAHASADTQAKASGDRSQELEDAVQHITQLLRAAEKRVEAERRLREERLTRVATEYEEKISGLIDSAATSGLLGTVGVELLLSGRREEGGLEEEQGVGTEAEQQLRCMLRLSNERNEALKGQMQQVLCL